MLHCESTSRGGAELVGLRSVVAVLKVPAKLNLQFVALATAEPPGLWEAFSLSGRRSWRSPGMAFPIKLLLFDVLHGLLFVAALRVIGVVTVFVENTADYSALLRY